MKRASVLPDEEVANTIKGRRGFFGIKIDDTVNERIWKAVISNQDILNVEFENIDVESERAAELLRALKHIKTIQFIGTEDESSLMKVDTADILCQALAELESLEVIGLADVEFGNAVIEAIAGSDSVRLSLKQLLIIQSKVTKDGFSAFAKTLPRFVSLQTLLFQADADLVVDSDSVSAVSQVIKSNDLLKTLHLYLNTDIACSYELFNAFMTSNTLKDAELQCFLPGMDPDGSKSCPAVLISKEDDRVDSVALRGPKFFEMSPFNTRDTSWGDIDIGMATNVTDQSHRSLSLDGWDIGLAETRSLCADLVAMGTTEYLSLFANQVGSEGCMLSIGRMLSTLPKLKELDLGFNAISGDMIVTLCNTIVRNDTLNSLCLSFNSIRDKGAMAFVECLINGKLSLSTLKVVRNKIGDGGIKAIVNALSESTVRLECLHFDTEECVSDDVYESLRDALKVNTMLKELKDVKNSTAATTRKGARALLAME